MLGLLVLAGLLLCSKRADRKEHWRWYLTAAIVSLTARTLDDPLCGSMPIGKHYI